MFSSTKLGLILSALPAAFATVYNVDVGPGGKLVYDPPYINAEIGDIVNFTFHPKNHTVTQSSFNAPCVPLAGGFNSGFTPVPAEGPYLPTYPVVVKDKNPIWVHCEQNGHCGAGMVFAINAPADPDPHSFNAFKALAIAINGTSTSTTAATATATNYYPTGKKSTSAPSATYYATSTTSYTTSTTASIETASQYYGSSYGEQYTSTPALPSSTYAPVDHEITVGADGKFAYNPANITAAIGDTVTFKFFPKNHTVTQSNFGNPCIPLDVSTPGSIGFKSGFQPVSPNATVNPTFRITVLNDNPIWGYCGQAGHCQAGMVFSINAAETGNHTFDDFVTLAKATNVTIN